MATSTSLPRIAFVGLGRMGHPMAARLLAAGFPAGVLLTRTIWEDQARGP
jgi:3-hydroxyisobutyrate dehydrogenase-like beta-hydroxyacid dehydrogenase